MAQHPLLNSRMRDFSLYEAARMSDEQVLELFQIARWGSITLQACPRCGTYDRHYFRAFRSHWRCKACGHEFSVTSGTMLDGRKLSLSKLLSSIIAFTSAAKGRASLESTRLICLSPKTARTLYGKAREALWRHRETRPLEGNVEADGGYFCGKPRKANRRPPRDVETIAARAAGKKIPASHRRHGYGNQANVRRRKKRRVVMVYREVPAHGGAIRTIARIAMAENNQIAELMAKRYVTPGATVMTDENPAYNSYSANYEHHAVEHSKEFSTPEGVNENQAESYFSRLRRAEYGIYHGFRPEYLGDYANEFAWREDTRRNTEGEKLNQILAWLLAPGVSRWWRGYFQGNHRNFELIEK